VTTTNPKKSKVTLSYPGAMLNIMVKVSKGQRFARWSTHIPWLTLIINFFMQAWFYTMLSQNTLTSQYFCFSCCRIILRMISIKNLWTEKVYDMTLEARIPSFSRYLFNFIYIKWNLYDTLCGTYYTNLEIIEEIFKLNNFRMRLNMIGGIRTSQGLKLTRILCKKL
jgi:hypothetical protein